jgi:hypothetical protein
MSEEELFAYWNAWLEQAQATNEADEHAYSHGVFLREPEVPAARVAESRKPYGPS